MAAVVCDKKIEVGNYIRFNGVFGKVVDIKENHIILDRDILNDRLLTRKISFDELKICDFKVSNETYNLIEEGDVLLLFDNFERESYKSEVINIKDTKLVYNYSRRNLLELKSELINSWHIMVLGINTKEQFKASSYFFKNKM